MPVNHRTAVTIWFDSDRPFTADELQTLQQHVRAQLELNRQAGAEFLARTNTEASITDPVVVGQVEVPGPLQQAEAGPAAHLPEKKTEPAVYTDEYGRLHACCPECWAPKGSQTTMGMPPDSTRNTNRVHCSKCKWRGIIHDLVPAKPLIDLVPAKPLIDLVPAKPLITRDQIVPGAVFRRVNAPKLRVHQVLGSAVHYSQDGILTFAPEWMEMEELLAWLNETGATPA